MVSVTKNKCWIQGELPRRHGESPHGARGLPPPRRGEPPLPARCHGEPPLPARCHGEPQHRHCEPPWGHRDAPVVFAPALEAG